MLLQQGDIIPAALCLVIGGSLASGLYLFVYNIFFHPLAKFRGPLAFRSPVGYYWKGYIEVIRGRSFCHYLKILHEKYGDVVRIGPNELHFSNPQAYHDIHNSKNRWDKDARLYKTFADGASLDMTTYAEAKARKDVLNRSFSTTAIESAETLLTETMQDLCAAFDRQSKAGKPADIMYAFRCMSLDVITTFCFGKAIHAVDAPDFKHPLPAALDASLPAFTAFKYARWLQKLVMDCPPKLSKIISPATAAVVDLQQMLLRQISELTDNPEKLNLLPHNMTIFHRLLDPEAHRNKTIPAADSLYAEAQVLTFAGADTVGVALMTAVFHLLKKPSTLVRLKQELNAAWPSLNQAAPRLRELENLPYLNAVIKECLRVSTGVTSGLPRVVPRSGATVAGYPVPAGAIVSCGSTFVHFNPAIFPSPEKFVPERWLESPELDNWLVAFSRGPRSCLGINLAWAELRLALSHVCRKFEMELAEPSPPELKYYDAFLPFFTSEHPRVNMTTVEG